MFQKKSNIRVNLLSLTLVLYLVFASEALAADSNIRIEMERATREEVRVAVTQFVLGKNSSDPEGLGLEARKILETDLRLSELFIKVTPEIYESLEQKERGKKEVDFWAWHQIGAQWLIKTEYSIFGRYKFVGDKILMKVEIYNMSESIADIIKDSHKVDIYPISHNAWIDVGQWPEYNKAIEKI